MEEWLDVGFPVFSVGEQETFETIYKRGYHQVEGWNEEELKMKFLAFVIELGHIKDNGQYKTYYERDIFATVEGNYLYLKSDFMIAKGILDKPSTPYFYFQEYKKLKDPSGDPVPQLIEGFLIAQQENGNGKPLYGCTVTGKYWDFFVMEGKNYCISDSFDTTKRDDLLKIIAILRKFIEILETKLL
jgi:hypothetical protein